MDQRERDSDIRLLGWCCGYTSKSFTGSELKSPIRGICSKNGREVQGIFKFSNKKGLACQQVKAGEQHS